MKLFFLIHSLSAGGAERVTLNLANYWVQKEWDITIVTFQGIKDFYQVDNKIKRIEINCLIKNKNIFKYIKLIWNIRKLVKELKPDIVISMMTVPNIYLSIAKIGIKKILFIGWEQVYPGIVKIGFIWNLLRKFLYRNLDAVIALTRENEEWLTKNTLAKKICIIPNPVTYPLKEGKIDYNIEEKINKNKKLILAIGTEEYSKGLDILIESFYKISEIYPEWELVIICGKETQVSLNEKIKSKKLENKVFIKDKTENIGSWYKIADIFVLSSRVEGFPNVLIEAMAYGCPVISFDCPTGPRDIIENGINGELVYKIDSDSLAMAMKKLMENEDLRKSYSKEAIKIREKFSVENIAKNLENIFIK